MKKLILFILLPFLGITQIKGIETKDTLSFYDMYTCGCPCLVYDDISKTYDYHYSFYDINHKIGNSEIDTIFNKFYEVLNLNGLSITNPFKIFGDNSHPNIKKIKNDFNSGTLKDERFLYKKNDVLITFMYSKEVIELFIYEDPYK